MSIKDDFQIFCENIQPNNIDTMKVTVGEIAKKLNKSYYNLDKDNTSNMYIVGSIGRETAIKGVSDLDLIFDLPNETFKKFDAYTSNGQSALLQEVKGILVERYPKTKISGDGQVIVIEFTNYTVELVPGFKQSDDNFKYPDTNNGGSWRITKPLSEIAESKMMSEETDKNFKYIANMVRAWRNKQGFKFGGLLIDTLTYNFLNKNEEYKNISFDDYFEMSKELFKYLKDLNKDQKYWYALGSNQEVYNSANGKFVKKAKKAYNKIKYLDCDSEEANSKLREIFGNEFPKVESTNEIASIYKSYSERMYRNTEQFVENLFPIDIRYDLNIECKVTQDGWRPELLSNLLKNHSWLSKNKKLEFYIVDTDTKGDYDIYWKVRNVGNEAIKRDMIRGQIIKTNNTKHFERTDFRGEHFVECYIVKNGVCVAKDEIDVPISAY